MFTLQNIFSPLFYFFLSNGEPWGVILETAVHVLRFYICFEVYLGPWLEHLCKHPIVSLGFIITIPNTLFSYFQCMKTHKIHQGQAAWAPTCLSREIP